MVAGRRSFIHRAALAIMTGMTDAPKPRWYRLSPDRFVIGLLAVECLLWLSERFQWFGFNHHKGWAVLLAVGMIVATAFLMVYWVVIAVNFRWRFQFSIRSLLILTVAVAVPCSWLGVEMNAAREQKAAVEAIRKVGWGCYYEWEAGEEIDALAPAWLRNRMGTDFFAWPVWIFNRSTKDTNAALEQMKDMTHIRWLDLGCSYISDDKLEQFTRMSQLEKLELNCTNVTDTGLKTLRMLQPTSRVGPQRHEDHERRAKGTSRLASTPETKAR